MGRENSAGCEIVHTAVLKRVPVRHLRAPRGKKPVLLSSSCGARAGVWDGEGGACFISYRPRLCRCCCRTELIGGERANRVGIVSKPVCF